MFIHPGIHLDLPPEIDLQPVTWRWNAFMRFEPEWRFSKTDFCADMKRAGRKATEQTQKVKKAKTTRSCFEAAADSSTPGQPSVHLACDELHHPRHLDREPCVLWPRELWVVGEQPFGLPARQLDQPGVE